MIGSWKAFRDFNPTHSKTNELRQNPSLCFDRFRVSGGVGENGASAYDAQRNQTQFLGPVDALRSQRPSEILPPANRNRKRQKAQGSHFEGITFAKFMRILGFPFEGPMACS